MRSPKRRRRPSTSPPRRAALSFVSDSAQGRLIRISSTRTQDRHHATQTQLIFPTHSSTQITQVNIPSADPPFVALQKSKMTRHARCQGRASNYTLIWPDFAEFQNLKSDEVAILQDISCVSYVIYELV